MFQAFKALKASMLVVATLTIPTACVCFADSGQATYMAGFLNSNPEDMHAVTCQHGSRNKVVFHLWFGIPEDHQTLLTCFGDALNVVQ